MTEPTAEGAAADGGTHALAAHMDGGQMFDSLVDQYNEAIMDTDKDRALRVVHDALAEGVSPKEIIFDVVIPAIELMIKHIGESPDANLAQHFLAAQIGAQVTDEMLEKFEKPPAIAGKIILGTALGDVHALGKKIVGGCLKSLMFQVIDLGVSVPPERFVEAAIEHNAPVIGISAMMMHTARGDQGCRAVRRILRERGLEKRIKIIVGGAPYRFDPHLFRMVEADGWAPDGLSAGRAVAGLIQGIEA